MIFDGLAMKLVMTGTAVSFVTLVDTDPIVPPAFLRQTVIALFHSERRLAVTAIPVDVPDT